MKRFGKIFICLALVRYQNYCYLYENPKTQPHETPLSFGLSVAGGNTEPHGRRADSHPGHREQLLVGCRRTEPPRIGRRRGACGRGQDAPVLLL